VPENIAKLNVLRLAARAARCSRSNLAIFFARLSRAYYTQ
jgi:hypothetical protein